MNSKSRIVRRPARVAAAILTTLGVAALSGCLEERVAWSPDGARAVVISQQDLFLCDAAGTLSPRLATDIYRAAWLGDAEHLVLARERGVDSWGAIVGAIGEERAARIASKAEEIWQRLEDGGSWGVTMVGRNGQKDVISIYLRERHAEGLQAKVGDFWKEIAETKAGLHEVVQARVTDDRIEIGTTVHAGLDRISELRPSRDGRAVAVVTAMEGDEDFGVLYVARANGATCSTLVAERTAAYPDWTPDGHSVVFVQQAGGATAKDEIGLGTLVRRRVVNDAGKIDLAPDRDELAGLIFSELARVRCLSDGRILFNASELCLPTAASDAEMQREQFFALDSARQSTLLRLIPRKTEGNLPQLLAFFEVSPDERQLLFGSTDGDVCVFTLASGEVEVIQAKGSSLQGAPVWRRNGEFTYLRRKTPVEGQEPAREAELVLHRPDEESLLSRDWPDDLINAVVK